MSRIRSIKPEFFTDEDIAALDPRDVLAFIGLWCHADKAGRLEDRPTRLSVLIAPYDRKNFDQRLQRLADAGFIIRYESSDLKKLIQIRTWEKHQRPHHTEVDSDLPPPDGYLTVKTPSSNGERTDGREGKGRERKGKERSAARRAPSPTDDLFEQFWKSFPPTRKHAKGKARIAWAKAITKATPEEIIVATVDYAASPVGRSEFAKGPEPWLNGECWLDDRASWNRQDSGGRPTGQTQVPVCRPPSAESLKTWNPVSGGVN